MVTKAQLEAEVAELRRQLAEQSSAQTAASTPKEDVTSDAGKSTPEGIADSLEAWSTQIEEVMTELEEFPHKRPVLFALGIFTLGYLLGRSR
ncbi:hypothetical protein [Ruegeria sp. Ofav3-42]|uniref:hypothetical protein n=1 Tax=Ruegeria sp. Ofav3-42 TaxID=2917759 RepID=UPI001EF59A2E|nr:hypothetical protein [Ruegeria sp. Ofav3-42]MCG7519989.1 hypothetical protein [Ruegeria sp. Ofav3-42]